MKITKPTSARTEEDPPRRTKLATPSQPENT